MDMRRWVGGLMLGGAAVLAGCTAAPRPQAASLPPVKTLQAADLSALAGDWVGTIRGKPGTGAPTYSAAGRVTVGRDGSFTGNIDGRPTTGQAAIRDGKVVFASSTLTGSAQLHEGGGRSVLVGEGRLAGREGEAAFELTRP
jgi:hypothetical protein